jgi:hypothetical protein
MGLLLVCAAAIILTLRNAENDIEYHLQRETDVLAWRRYRNAQRAELASQLSQIVISRFADGHAPKSTSKQDDHGINPQFDTSFEAQATQFLKIQRSLDRFEAISVEEEKQFIDSRKPLPTVSMMVKIMTSFIQVNALAVSFPFEVSMLLTQNMISSLSS